MCREILSPIHEELAVPSGLDASDVWRCAGHGLYVQLRRTLSSTSGEHASKAICSRTRPPKWILWKPVESITDLITLLVMTRSKVTWIVRKIQITSLIRADTTWIRPPSWKFLNEGKLLRRRINNVTTRFTSYLSTNQRFLRPVHSIPGPERGGSGNIPSRFMLRRSRRPELSAINQWNRFIGIFDWCAKPLITLISRRFVFKFKHDVKNLRLKSSCKRFSAARLALATAREPAGCMPDSRRMHSRVMVGNSDQTNTLFPFLPDLFCWIDVQ